MNRLRHTGPVSEDEVIVGNRFMTAEAFLNETCILAVRLVIISDEAGESPPPGLFVFPGILDHKLHLNECGG